MNIVYTLIGARILQVSTVLSHYTIADVVTMLIALSALCYILGTGVYIARRSKLGSILIGMGWLWGLVLFLLNWVMVSYPPFANMYQVLSVLSLCFMPIYLVLHKREHMLWVLPYFSLASSIPLIGVLFMERQVVWELTPALQSPYFVPHVLSYMIAYALCAVAFMMTIAGWVMKGTHKEGHYSRYDLAIYRILQFGFPFMTIGLLLGAIWAEEAWGVYWSWDTKETWSLITWMLYLVYFHCRRDQKLRSWAHLFQVLAFMALLITFLLVNFLPQLASALHGYT